MKQTENYGLNLMEAADLLSAKPLNENAGKIEAALMAQESAIAGRMMMACGSYTGSGTRTVAIQTPGFTPRVVLMRRSSSLVADKNSQSDMSVKDGWCLWLGTDMSAQYEVYAYRQDVDELVREKVETTVGFTAKNGELSWSIDVLPGKYAGVREDHGPAVMNNASGAVYEWIAIGTAE